MVADGCCRLMLLLMLLVVFVLVLVVVVMMVAVMVVVAVVGLPDVGCGPPGIPDSQWKGGEGAELS